ncbi:MAG: 16S rRNA (guanine(527)-N(7))-methyltransferase RsmG [Pseudomonadota bacterium]
MDNETDAAAIEAVLRRLGIVLSLEAKHRLAQYVSLLERWQAAKNLVSASTLESVWLRHIGDSLQLIPLIDAACGPTSEAVTGRAPDPQPSGVDLGSGAGLPGMVLCLATADRAPAKRYDMTLIEANQRKVAFLRTVSRETSVPVTTQQQRIEAANVEAVEFVTGRALAPLPKLVSLAQPWLQLGATGFFHKGVERNRELQEWPERDGYRVVEHPSQIDPESAILQISSCGTHT